VKNNNALSCFGFRVPMQLLGFDFFLAILVSGSLFLLGKEKVCCKKKTSSRQI